MVANQATRDQISTLRSRRLAYVSLLISALEIGSFLLGVGVVRGFSVQPNTVLRILGVVWLLSGVSSFGFALASLRMESHKGLAALALCLSIMCFLICGTQMVM
jgi:hypothetical protein